MNLLFAAIVILVAAFSPHKAHGAQAAARAVGVRQAIESAVETNLASKLARADSEAARAQALQAASGLLPGVIGSASQSRVYRENLAALGFGGGGAFPTLIGPFNSFDARVR